MPDDENVIEEDVVRIYPDLSGFRRRLERDLKREVYGEKVEIPVRFVEEQAARNYVLSLRTKMIQQDYRARQRAEERTTRLAEQAATRRASIADREARATAAAERRATIAAEREAERRTAALEREARERKRALEKYRKAPPIIDYGGKGIRPLNLLYGTVAALTPALFAMASNAVQASTALVALGSAGIGAAIGIGGLIVAFQGIGDAWKLRNTVQNEALKTDANAAKTSVKSAAQQRAAADRVADALGEYRTALREEAQAEDAVHKARVEAARDLDTLRQKVRDLNNEYKSNSLSVREAEQAERTTNRNFFATGLQRLRAHQDTLDARTRLQDTALERRQAREDLADSLKKGVDRADRVVQARDNLTDAKRRRQRAGRALRRARTGDDTVDAITSPAVSSAAAQLKDKIAQMAPAARDIYYWFDKNYDRLLDMQRAIAQKVLPGFYKFLVAIDTRPGGRGKTTLELFADAAGDLGKIAGDATAKVGRFSQTSLFRKGFDKIQRNNAKGFTILADAAVKLNRPLTRILAAASPLFPKMAQGLSSLVDRFDAFIARTSRSGALTKWFDDAYESGRKWLHIVGNLIEFVGDLFRLSLPTGTSLVDKLVDFTDRMTAWSSSPNGQRQITAFFDKFRNLPYGQIADFFVEGAKFFVGFRTIAWAKANPFFAALGTFAASNPGAAMGLLSALTGTMTTVLGLITANPVAATTLLAMFSAWRGLKAANLALSIPALSGIRDLLTSKFKVLDKFIGGGATTGTMHVNAGVVNVYGKAIAGPGGITPGTPGNPTGPAGKTARVGNTAVLGSGITAAALLGYEFASSGYQRGKAGKGFLSPFEDFRRNPNAETALGTLQMASVVGWLGWAAGTPQAKSAVSTFAKLAVALSPLPALLGKVIPKKTPTAQQIGGKTTEQAAMERLQNNLKVFGKNSDITKDALSNYVRERQKRVKEYVDYIRSTQGPIAADKAQAEQDKRSRDVLSDLMQQYGWTKNAADTYTRYVFNASTATDTARKAAQYASTKFDSLGNSLDTTRGKADAANTRMGVLKDTINATVGDHVIALSTKNYDEVKKQLDLIYATQHVLYNPTYSNSASGADSVSSQNQFLDPKTGLPKKYMKADGGYIIGPGTAHSDSIPARLSNGEYVMPAEAVQHYGLGVMENMRARRYATGGLVGEIPMIVNLPKKGLQVPAVSAPSGGSDQEYTGRAPRGLGAVAGLGQRMMQAVIEIHRRFPWASVTSGFRPGAITVTGNRSYHGKRRATDWPASMQLFNYFVQRFGAVAKEIIYSPAGARQIWNGRPHMYSGAVRDTHWNHVHLALAKGGPVNTATYDGGGALPPGFTLAYNGTGRNETVRTAKQEQALSGPMRLDRRDIAALAMALSGQGISMDGRKVAEVTNRYNYLPAGV